MPEKVFVGIDTSNYTTSCAIADENGKILHNFKILLPVSKGERGLRQSEAVFAHIKNLQGVSDSIKALEKDFKIMAIGYSAFPRDTHNSYMPCFLTGEAVARMLSAFEGVDAYAFSHQAGHIKAAVYSSGASLDGDFISFHVSGGTTEILYVKQNENSYYDIEIIGGSIDLHAGQAIDRIGVALGLDFPCGRQLESLASTNSEKIPSPKISVKDFNCNLSGLENLALNLYKKTQSKELVCAYTIDFIGKTLEKLTENLRNSYKDTPIVYAGGVMSNSIIKKRLKNKFSSVYFAEPEYSSDNASGIALLARERYLKERK